MPRTPDGHPDLQGNWSSATLTPFQRPENKGAVLTQEEVDSLEGRAAGYLERASREDVARHPVDEVGSDMVTLIKTERWSGPLHRTHKLESSSGY